MLSCWICIPKDANAHASTHFRRSATTGSATESLPRKLSAQEQNVNRLRQPRENTKKQTRLHARRAAGGDRGHRHTRGAVAACSLEIKGAWAGSAVCQ